jgi:ABC-type antimicrobial peptide transport system permease subunit
MGVGTSNLLLVASAMQIDVLGKAAQEFFESLPPTLQWFLGGVVFFGTLATFIVGLRGALGFRRAAREQPSREEEQASIDTRISARSCSAITISPI